MSAARFWQLGLGIGGMPDYSNRAILTPPEPRVELFARRSHEGWDAWGDEDSGEGHENAPQRSLTIPPPTDGLTFGGPSGFAETQEQGVPPGWYR